MANTAKTMAYSDRCRLSRQLQTFKTVADCQLQSMSRSGSQFVIQSARHEQVMSQKIARKLSDSCQKVAKKL